MDAVRFIHLIAMAFFVGGQLMLAAAVVPALRSGDRERMRAVARRFAWLALGAIALLALTGVYMASEEDRWDDALLHVKLTLVLVAAGLVGWHIRRPGNRALDGLILLSSLAIVWLGVELAH